MRRLKKIVFCCCAVVFFAACQEDNEVNTEPKLLQFTTQNIQQKVISRMQNESWEMHDEIGFFVEDLNNHEYVCWNSCYENSAAEAKSALFKPKDIDDGVYYPFDSFSWRVYAYYPYESFPEGDEVKFYLDVTDQNNITDYLYSERIRLNAIPSRVFDLPFWHCLTKIIVRIFPGEEAIISDLMAVSAVKLNNVNLSGEFNLTQKTLTNVSSGDINFELHKLYDQYEPTQQVGKVAQGFVVKSYPDTDNTSIVITIDGAEYLFEVQESVWNTSSVYIYNFILDANPLHTVYLESSTVEAWETGNPNNWPLNVGTYP